MFDFQAFHLRPANSSVAVIVENLIVLVHAFLVQPNLLEHALHHECRRHEQFGQSFFGYKEDVLFRTHQVDHFLLPGNQTSISIEYGSFFDHVRSKLGFLVDPPQDVLGGRTHNQIVKLKEERLKFKDQKFISFKIYSVQCTLYTPGRLSSCRPLFGCSKHPIRP